MPHHQGKFRVEKPSRTTAAAVATAAAGPSKSRPTQKRRSGGKHQMAACTRCKLKRKKCDGNYPVCGGCQKSNSDCTILDVTTKRVIPRNYLETLESTIADLKKQLEAYKIMTLANNKLDPEQITLNPKPNMVTYSPSSIVSSEKEIKPPNIEYISLNDPHNIVDIHQQPSVKQRIHDDSIPDFSIGNQYIKEYLYNIQYEYPFLDKDDILRIFNSLMNGGDISSQGKFFIYIIFAIGNYMISESSNYSIDESFTDIYYSKAIENFPSVSELNNLLSIQGYLLLSMFYHIASPEKFYSTFTFAISGANSMNLHAEPYFQIEKDPHTNLKNKIFWSIYSLERVHGLIFGNSFIINDLDISASNPDNPENLDSLLTSQIVKLRRIQSNICSFIHNESMINAKTIRSEIMNELNDWLKNHPVNNDVNSVSVMEHYNRIQISYHYSVCLLIRPLILELKQSKRSSISSEDLKWFKMFIQSNILVGKNFNNFYNSGKLALNLTYFHSIIVCGVSFLYCLWLNHSMKFFEMGDFNYKKFINGAISNFQNILNVFALRNSQYVIYKEFFNNISNKILKEINFNAEVTSTLLGIPSTFSPTSSSSSIESLLEDNNYLKIDSEFFANNMMDPVDNYTDFENLLSENMNVNGLETENHSKREGNKNIWEILGCTRDKFLKSVYYELEKKFGSI